MKSFLLIFAVSLSPALAQFGWDDEPAAAATDLDQFNTAVRTTTIEPIVPVFQPFVSPVVDVDPLVEQCDLEPEVAQVYRASVLSESTRDPQPATSYGRSAVLSDSTRLSRRSSAKADHSPQGTRHIGEADCPQFLGRLSANPYASDSTANPYSPAGSPYSSTSVNNRFGPYGSPYSSTSARNPYATDAPDIVAQDGTYLGKLSDNPYDPDSVSNPYGRYGSPYSSTSINNPYSTYGSPYSSQSPNNPYGTQAPLLFGD
jgi:hypothetical protein